MSSASPWPQPPKVSAALVARSRVTNRWSYRACALRKVYTCPVASSLRRYSGHLLPTLPYDLPRYLRPFHPWLRRLDGELEMSNLPGLFRPVLHMVFSCDRPSVFCFVRVGPGRGPASPLSPDASAGKAEFG